MSIDRVIDSGHRLRSVVVTPSRVERLLDGRPEIEEQGIPVYVLDRALLADTVGFDLHRGVVASADRRPVPSVADIAASDARRIAVLVGLNDAENVGVIARAARGLQLDAIVLDPTCTDAYSRRTVRVSMGEVLHLPVSRATTWPDDLEILHGAGFETWAMTPADDAHRPVGAHGDAASRSGSPSCSAPRVRGSTRGRCARPPVGFGSPSIPRSTR